MAITCACPSCATSFKVKDEYAGKRAKCPKCGEPLTIPSAFDAKDTVKMPPPAAKTAPRTTARPQPVEAKEEEAPKPAKKPRVVDDEADDRPKGKRRRDADEEYDAPSGKKRRATEDENEDRPKKKKRRREEPKKASNLPLLLGIGMLVLLVLVGGGIIAAVAMGKANEQANATLFTGPANPPLGGPGNQPTRPPNTPTRPGNPSTRPTQPEPKPTPVATLTAQELAKRYTEYDGKWITLKGQVVNTALSAGGMIQVSSPNGAQVYFEAPADGFGKAFDFMEEVEVVGVVGGDEKQIFVLGAKLVKRTPAAPAIEVSAKSLWAEINADVQAAAAKYDGKLVRITGFSDKQSTEKTLYLTGDQSAAGGGQGVVSCMIYHAEVGKVTFTAGRPATLLGVGMFLSNGKQQALVLQHCRSAQASGRTGPGPGDGTNPGTGGTPAGQPVATLTPDELIRDVKKYEGKFVVVSGKAEKDVTKDDLVLRLALQKTDTKRIGFRFGHTTYMPVEVKKGQKVELWGKVDQVSGDKFVSLGDVELLTPAPDLKLGELIDAYLKDGTAAEKKYGGSRWRFTGKVVSKTEIGSCVLEERPGTPPVQVAVNLEDDETESVRVGNTITFYATMPGVGLRRTKDSASFTLVAGRLAPTTVPPGPK